MIGVCVRCERDALLLLVAMMTGGTTYTNHYNEEVDVAKLRDAVVTLAGKTAPTPAVCDGDAEGIARDKKVAAAAILPLLDGMDAKLLGVMIRMFAGVGDYAPEFANLGRLVLTGRVVAGDDTAADAAGYVIVASPAPDDAHVNYQH